MSHIQRNTSSSSAHILRCLSLDSFVNEPKYPNIISIFHNEHLRRKQSNQYFNISFLLLVLIVEYFNSVSLIRFSYYVGNSVYVNLEVPFL